MAEMAAPSHFPDRLYGLALGSATLALWLYPRFASGPSHKTLATMTERPVSKFAFGRFDRAGQLPALRVTDNSVLPTDARFLESIDDCADAVRVERHGVQQALPVDLARASTGDRRSLIQ